MTGAAPTNAAPAARTAWGISRKDVRSGLSRRTSWRRWVSARPSPGHREGGRQIRDDGAAEVPHREQHDVQRGVGSRSCLRTNRAIAGRPTVRVVSPGSTSLPPVRVLVLYTAPISPTKESATLGMSILCR
ncbi:hypothetical protein TK78_00325 [Streptomyces sp. Tue 6075]|nr:hypothetical protein TK78_00325 [Streptomyces sp. Tue 6075]